MKYSRNTTLSELFSSLSISGKHPSWKCSTVRNTCKSWNKHLVGNPCENCGYNKHTELCHIKDVTLFPLETTLGEINDIKNIVVLCPNCHWEFDNGLLEIRGISKSSRSQKTYRKCPNCNGYLAYSSHGKLCKKCHFKSRELINWPEDQDLLKMVKESNYLAVSKILGVSDNAIRHRLKRRKLL